MMHHSLMGSKSHILNEAKNSYIMHYVCFPKLYKIENASQSWKKNESHVTLLAFIHIYEFVSNRT